MKERHLLEHDPQISRRACSAVNTRPAGARLTGDPLERFGFALLMLPALLIGGCAVGFGGAGGGTGGIGGTSTGTCFCHIDHIPECCDECPEAPACQTPAPDPEAKNLRIDGAGRR